MQVCTEDRHTGSTCKTKKQVTKGSIHVQQLCPALYTRKFACCLDDEKVRVYSTFFGEEIFLRRARVTLSAIALALCVRVCVCEREIEIERERERERVREREREFVFVCVYAHRILPPVLPTPSGGLLKHLGHT